MRKTYQIIEYGSFVRGKEVRGYTSLPQDTFDALENFILSNSSKSTDALELMGLSARKNIGKVITAKNYVGVITLKDGTSIEILPKIYSSEQVTETKAKQLLVEMLKTLRNSPYKSLQTTNVNVAKMNIFEVFIRMFIDEVFWIVKSGLKCSYETVQSNGTVFKGKMKFKDQIRCNYAHKERCYMEYDEFNLNRAENKLLEATLLYLYKVTESFKNKNDIKTLLNSFIEVDASIEYKEDFSKIMPDRNMKDYASALMWSKIFLEGKSFTAFLGSEVAFALLFPMENLFERYVAVKLKKYFKESDYSVSAQDRAYYLFDKQKCKFLMKPDIVIRNKFRDRIYIMDTKWKILSDKKSNYGISQSDMYQMYAYHKKYAAENVTLIYPYTEEIADINNKEFCTKDGVTVIIKFLDLYDMENSIQNLVDGMV